MADAPTPLDLAVLPDILLVEDLAARLRISPGSARRLLRLGTLPGRKVGRRWIVERRALIVALRPDPDAEDPRAQGPTGGASRRPMR